MPKRKLKRQLSLLQLIMLGTAATISAAVFVLTGHAAGLVGPAAVLAMIVAGLLNYSVALNYCELATTYPVTGGGVTYVREAWGPGLLAFLVGSLDCLSSTFYAALSAVGFSYSLRIFIPGLPIVPTAIIAILVFVVLNILDVTKVGNVQIVLGGGLLLALIAFLLGGLLRPGGFQWSTFTQGPFFIHQGVGANLAKMLNTVALVYCAYIGYEIIAHDAEEAKNPSRNIPIAILASLTICMVIYVLVPFVIMGTLPWQEVAGSETALTDVVARFMPTVGVPMMAVAGIVATLTTINASLLSGTREALTLSRVGLWPQFMSRLSRFRTPHVACWVIGLITCLVAAVGLVDFLSYASSTGFLFVLFWSNLAMIRLRKMHPDLPRPFKAPLFPLTPLLAMLTCLLVIGFASREALFFGAGVLGVSALFYYAQRPISRLISEHVKLPEVNKDRILVAAANPQTVKGLLRLASIIARASEDSFICVLNVVPGASRRLSRPPQPSTALQQIISVVRDRNVAVYAKSRPAPTVAQGILDEINHHGNVALLLVGWPGPLDAQALPENPIKVVLQKAHADVAVLLDHGIERVRRILVPVGGGPHSRLALALAHEIALAEGAETTALRVLAEAADGEEVEDKAALLSEVCEEVLGEVPQCFTLRVRQAASVREGALAEVTSQPYDLIVLGASEEWALDTRLFGSVDDWLADRAPCSVLLCRRHELEAVSWLRRQVKKIEREYRVDE